MTAPKILTLSAVFGQFLALFPLAVLFCGIGLKMYAPWVYIAVYAVWAVFYAAGHICGRFAEEFGTGRHSRRLKALILFLSRMAVVIPAGIFVAVTAAADITSTALFYVLPGGAVMFYGAHSSFGKGYSDVFSRGWVGLYFALGLISTILMWSSHEEELSSQGTFRICAGFGVLLLLAALHANQTNIDVCTRQRAEGRSVLPNGLRRYNALIITGICAAVIGLFLFARPLAGLIKSLISLIMSGVIRVFEGLGSCVGKMPDDIPEEPGGEVGTEPTNPTNPLAEIAFVLLIIGMLILLFKLRRHIWSSIKSLFAPLFRKSNAYSDVPFCDEILTSDAKSLTPGARRKAERGLARQYKRESDPARKYRYGYALFLVRLGKTSRPPEPPDTTTIHREKGESAFETDLGELSGVYNRVRYGETAPTAEELARQERLLTELK